jgi:glycosyltransferase involved in cell wall biosynthesis
LLSGPRRVRVVSLTPTPLSRDSRTLKSAVAYARFGFESIVIEGVASEPGLDGLPVIVAAVAPAHPGVLRRAARGTLRRPRQGLAAFAVFAAYLAYYVFTYCVRPLAVMRRGAIYHLHSYEYFPLVRLWCALFGGRHIYDAHDFYSGIQNDAEMSSAQRWIRRFQLWLETRCVASAAAFLTVNEGTAELMAAQFGRSPTVLRNCHDFRLDRPPPRGLRETVGVASGDFLVVSPGNWKPGQTTEEAVEALAELPAHVHLAFVGGGYEWLRPLIERKGLSTRIHLVGPVAANAVVPYIASADAALIHYRRYNANYANALPNGFFQSLAAGLPLVHSDLPGIVAAAGAHGAGIVVDPCSPGAIAGGLRRLVEDAEERKRQRDGARRLSTMVNFEKEEQILYAIVRELVAVGAGAESCAE